MRKAYPIYWVEQCLPPPNSHPPRILCILCENRVFENVIGEDKSMLGRVALKSNMTGVLIRRGEEGCMGGSVS